MYEAGTADDGVIRSYGLSCFRQRSRGSLTAAGGRGVGDKSDEDNSLGRHLGHLEIYSRSAMCDIVVIMATSMFFMILQVVYISRDLYAASPPHSRNRLALVYHWPLVLLVRSDGVCTFDTPVTRFPRVHMFPPVVIHGRLVYIDASDQQL